MERGQIREKRECAHFMRNIAAKERERRRRKARERGGEEKPPGIIFQITTADSFTVGSGGFLDSRFGKHDISLCTVRSSIHYLSREISVSQFMFCFWGFVFFLFRIGSIGV